jgi:hypothetical protein
MPSRLSQLREPFDADGQDQSCEKELGHHGSADVAAADPRVSRARSIAVTWPHRSAGVRRLPPSQAGPSGTAQRSRACAAGSAGRSRDLGTGVDHLRWLWRFEVGRPRQCSVAHPATLGTNPGFRGYTWTGPTGPTLRLCLCPYRLPCRLCFGPAIRGLQSPSPHSPRSWPWQQVMVCEQVWS